MHSLNVIAFLTLAALSSAQTQAPADLKEHTSTLGLKFVAVPGTPVLFAAYETRVADWQAFLTESGYAWTYKPHFEQGPDHPAVGITLQDAQVFCTWLTEKERKEGKINTAQSYRLPTPAEWDAAIGLLRTRKPDLTVDDKLADDRNYPWGVQWPPPAGAGNYADDEIPGYTDGFPFTAPVGKFPPTPEGLHDLAGNVWEWCWDVEIRAVQTGVLRGASWAYFRPECLVASYAYPVPADLRMATIGFRCVFEDARRSAVFLASVESEKERIRTQRREMLLGGTVDKAEVAAMREKLQQRDASSAIPDLSTLVPAQPGKAYQNTLGMTLVPLAGTPKLAGATEVRVQDFEAWLRDAGRIWNDKPSFLLGGVNPAAGVRWDEADAFCQWLTTRERASKLLPTTASYRLPSDVEWSLMAGLADETGGDPAQRHAAAGAHYPWSAAGAFPPPNLSTNLDASRMQGYTDNFIYTAPVQTEAVNAAGILGLGGNVAEWCADAWPGADKERVIRGGSWMTSDKEALRTGFRRHAPRGSAHSDVGFRLLLDLGAP